MRHKHGPASLLLPGEEHLGSLQQLTRLCTAPDALGSAIARCSPERVLDALAAAFHASISASVSAATRVWERSNGEPVEKVLEDGRRLSFVLAVSPPETARPAAADPRHCRTGDGALELSQALLGRAVVDVHLSVLPPLADLSADPDAFAVVRRGVRARGPPQVKVC